MLYIAFHHFPIGSFPYRGNVIPIRPKFSSPQLLLKCRALSEDFPGGNTFAYLYNSPWRYLGMSTTQHMNVILVCAQGFHFNGIPLFDAYRRFFDNLGHVSIQKSFTGLDRKDNMVMDLPRTMRTLLYRICSWRFHSLRRVPKKEDPVAS